MFGKMIELKSGISTILGDGKVEAPPPTGMPADGVVLYSGGQVTNEFVLGEVKEQVFTGPAATAAIAHNRYQSPTHESQRLASLDRRRNLDDRLRALGVKI